MPEPVSESVFHFLSGTGQYPSFPAEISGSGLLSLSPAAWVQAYQRAERAIGKQPDPGIVQNLRENLQMQKHDCSWVKGCGTE